MISFIKRYNDLPVDLEFISPMSDQIQKFILQYSFVSLKNTVYKGVLVKENTIEYPFESLCKNHIHLFDKNNIIEILPLSTRRAEGAYSDFLYNPYSEYINKLTDSEQLSVLKKIYICMMESKTHQ